jgi:phosphoribosylaminoimidazolecarboxamide formyltransferase/IMP cyclohydrolase
MSPSIKRALISVFNKEGILEFAQFLEEQGVEMVSTGGTAKLLQKEGVQVTEIEELTGFPEILDGRVKTLHPLVHGGLLYKRDDKLHLETIKKQQIKPIDLVVVNLYPFQEVSKDDTKSFEQKIEMIDIGGPSMLRSAAKNYASVTVICDNQDFERVEQEIKEQGKTRLKTRKELAAKVFAHTSQFDARVASFLDPDFKADFMRKLQDLRYGENPHQKASAWQNLPLKNYSSIPGAKKLHGKELSFNNLLDADAALNLALEFPRTENFAAIIKHTNPCGAGVGASIHEAFQKAHSADSLSAFGGIVVINQTCDQDLAKLISQSGFFEIIIAPEFTPEALEILELKKNVRILAVGQLKKATKALNTRSILGGQLVQDQDLKPITAQDLQLVAGEPLSTAETKEALFAWKIVKNLKSNAISLTKNGQTLGLGLGQTSRVGSMAIALEQAKEQSVGSTCASDAFFPFADSIELAGKAGISLIVQPGGSKRDSEVIAAAQELGIKMVFTHTRSFKH